MQRPFNLSAKVSVLLIIGMHRRPFIRRWSSCLHLLLVLFSLLLIGLQVLLLLTLLLLLILLLFKLIWSFFVVIPDIVVVFVVGRYCYYHWYVAVDRHRCCYYCFCCCCSNHCCYFCCYSCCCWRQYLPARRWYSVAMATQQVLRLNRSSCSCRSSSYTAAALIIKLIARISIISQIG